MSRAHHQQGGNRQGWVTPAVKDLFAGSLAGMASLVVCYPLDIVRTRLQTAEAGRFTGVVDCFVQTVRGEGPLALYKGMASPLAAQVLQKAVMFWGYGLAQRYLLSLRTRRQPAAAHKEVALPPQLATWELYLCGVFAGSVNTVVATPVELVRNRLMVQYHQHGRRPALQPQPQAAAAADTPLYTGPIDCARRIVREQGMRGLWRGFGPTLLRDGPGVGAWYAAFEVTKVKSSVQNRQHGWWWWWWW